MRTLVEALDRPSTLKALVRKTGYPLPRVLAVISEARADGVAITARMRGERYSEDMKPTVFEVTRG